MPNRQDALELLREYVKNPSLLNHSEMVAKAMEGYAKSLKLDQEKIDEWYIAGLLHDLDWEKYPDEHPNKAVNEILPSKGYSKDITEAIKAHGPERTGKYPDTLIERYLFACDELSGFINAASLIRPDKLNGMEVGSIKKKLKDKRFAANVNRDDINKGVELINKPLDEHIDFLIKTFQQ